MRQNLGFMDKRILKYLFDIQTCIKSINDYVGERKVFDEYNRNPMLQDAVERNIAVIGEAMNQALKIDEKLPISFARKIVGTRNRLIHGYDDVDNVEIWNIIVNNLPLLEKEIVSLLPESE